MSDLHKTNNSHEEKTTLHKLSDYHNLFPRFSAILLPRGFLYLALMLISLDITTSISPDLHLEVSILSLTDVPGCELQKSQCVA